MKKVYTLLSLLLTLAAPVYVFADGSTDSVAQVATKVPAVATTMAVDSSVAVSKTVTSKSTPSTETVKDIQTTQSWLQGMFVIIIEAVVAIVTPIISILLMFLIRKWNLKIEQDKVDWALDKGIGYAEQLVKKALKDGEPMAESGIKEAAVEKSREVLQQYGLADKFGSWLADGIEARLGQRVVEAGGAKKVVEASGAKKVAEAKEVAKAEEVDEK